MVKQANQTSIRIVSVDHYMSKPDPQFDTCYSEFRGSEIKQVPVIRLFGSNTEGIHSCVHIHGVFPYFYIPYDGSVTDKLVVDQKVYQLACALDKGINVSLGCSASQAKHVFKIVLVKGIPIYGYHRNSHHYFKIYMYNPSLLRNATQLLMNGTILSGTYQVHETHIPYILQFFIDYNLYGMSFLELNTNGLRQRKNVAENANKIPPKMSISEIEIDVLASDILNREPEESDTGEFANPGIASIWKDEQTRRQLLNFEQPERMNLSQDSGSAREIITESDRFYRARLLSKLSKEFASSSSADEKRTAPRSAYPSEANEGEALLDASCIVNHARPSGGHSNESLYDSQISYHFDASSVVDEEKIMSMSQNPDMTLGEEDYNMLEIMRELEEQETNNIDSDCLLAPLTQSSGDFNRSVIQTGLNLSQANKRLNASMYGDLDAVCLMSDQAEGRTLNPDELSFDSDDEFLLDFSQKQSLAANNEATETNTLLNDSDDGLLSGGCIPQLDGGDDSFKSVSVKRTRSNKESKTPNNSSAKKMRIDLTQPLSRKSLTPRRVTFALSPKENDVERTKRVLKEFEDSSPNTLKNFEIRIPKLGLIKKSILFTNRNRSSPMSGMMAEPSIPMKNLKVCIPKLDPTTYNVQASTSKALDSTPLAAYKLMSSAHSEDRYQLARTYDFINNFDPLEGPSTPKSQRARRKNVTPNGKGQPKPKRLKLEDDMRQIELILSERFKNIVRLSPKVLIKPLLLNDKPAVNSELSLDDYSSPRKMLPENDPQSDTSGAAECNKSPNRSSSVAGISAPSTPTATTPAQVGKIADETSTSDEVGKVAEETSTNDEVEKVAEGTSTNKEVEKVAEGTSTNDEVEKIAEGTNDEVEKIAEGTSTNKEVEKRNNDKANELTAEIEGMDVEFSLPSTSDSCDADETTPYNEREIHTTRKENLNEENVNTICIEDNDSDDAQMPTSSLRDKRDPKDPVVLIEADSDDDIQMITPSLLDDLPPKGLFEKDDEGLRAAIDLLDDENDTPAGPSVTIDNQLDGVVELMDEDQQRKTGNSAGDGEADEQSTDDDANMQSFCEKTLLCEIDDINSDSDDSYSGSWNKNETEKDDQLIITLAASAPTGEDAQRAIDQLEIPAVVNTTPFYSDPADVTGRKEVGHTVLNIAGNSLNDEQEFTSTIAGLGSLKHLRYDNLQSTFGEAINDVLGPIGSNGPSSERMKELVTSEECVVITPSELPPNRTEAANWIGNRCRERQVDAVVSVDSDSPVRVKSVDTIMALDDGAQLTRSSPRKVLEASDGHTDLPTKSKSPTKSVGATMVAKENTVDEIASSQQEQVQHNRPNPSPIKENLSQPPSTGTSDQSDLIEQSNADISTATPIGFKVGYENLQEAKSKCEYNYLTIMSLEVHVNTRGDLRPNPSIDPIAAIFYRIHNDVPSDYPKASSVCGIILSGDQAQNDCASETDGKVCYKYNQSSHVADVVVVSGERKLYEQFLQLISIWDPDIFTGYEIESVSWGYVIERGYALDMNIMKKLSRVPSVDKVQVSEEEQRELLEMHDYSAGLKIPGRILMDIWRLMRHEIALTSYTFENVAYHVLHRRVPNHSYRQLSRLWNKPYSRWIVLEYYLERVNGNLEILNQLDLIGRTAELAKLFGIQFYEVLSRGSQFRVESMMLRIAKPKNFVSVSPSIHQRAHMRAPEYLPLILEPNSRFYADPIIVLDFQSLYPSIIIAYNYCFSTCLGRIEHLGEDTSPFEFGASHLRVPPKMLKALLDKNLVTFSPCGIAFVKKRVREGVLPRMLSEILNTRLMVKKSMKLHKDNSILQRVLHSRQLGLKLIANVTYGYTAANFSGRMPCVEVGDSVVAKGRETLERAIKLVEETERWGAKVVYGDTDSLFVLCPGRTKKDAFKIGEEIAEAVTKENPPPVKLKLEKVYQPSILQTKKRYVGYMYESADQQEPVYEAKGIETVRRDGCPVVAKMLEKVLRILFETCDVSKVKQYTCRQFTKILEGRVNLQDFIFAKEFRGENGYKPGACVPALELTRKWKQTDPRREPRQGQRVPYVIISGPPLVPLIRLVRSPDELLSNEGLKINANYYIVKAIIPPLNRCLLLIGADVNQWYNELPRKTLMLHNTGGVPADQLTTLAKTDQQQHKKVTISQYFSTTNCIVDCGKQTHHGVCKDCRQQPQRALVHVMNKVNRLERKLELTEKMCRSCCQRTFETACISLDCPVLFSLNQRTLEYKQVQYYRDLIDQMF
uniref:DNA polymerase zeta catalytic subunit n=1 Tax=Anopheles funestus TaxID=62324 RepID=A0A4Y0BKG0_ANOFN